MTVKDNSVMPPVKGQNSRDRAE